ncbi:MAG: hypothetical protein ABL883_05400 [Terricaulis sp.]
MGLFRGILVGLIALVALVFLVQNLATIEVAFLTWSFAAPRALVFVLLFAVGLIAGYLVHAVRMQVRRSKQVAAKAVSETPPAAS